MTGEKMMYRRVYKKECVKKMTGKKKPVQVLYSTVKRGMRVGVLYRIVHTVHAHLSST